MKNFAIIFPGQNSQSIGMLQDLNKDYPLVKETFMESSDILGYDLWQLIQKGPKSELNKTWKTQPIILSASVAIFKIWQTIGKLPVFMAGHSLGEYSALVCANVIDFKTAIKLVETRGYLMQEAIPIGTGAMYAIIGLEHILVAECCKKISKINQLVSIANYNSIDQVVIAGEKNAVKKTANLCKTLGAKHVLPLNVSAPSHCALMLPAAKKLAKILEKIIFNTPTIPIINNVDVKIEFSIKNIRNALVRQLYNPVRWVEIIEYIIQQGINNFIEIGPGNILSNLIKNVKNIQNIISINNRISLNSALLYYTGKK